MVLNSLPKVINMGKYRVCSALNPPRSYSVYAIVALSLFIVIVFIYCSDLTVH